MLENFWFRFALGREIERGGVFFWVFFFLGGGGLFFFFWSIFLVFSRKNPTFLTFWTDFLSFPLGFRWFFIGKNLFFYILDGFPVISLRFSLVFPRGKTLFSLHFGQISCHFLRFLGFEARLVRLKRSGGGWGGGAQPPHLQTPLGL